MAVPTGRLAARFREESPGAIQVAQRGVVLRPVQRDAVVLGEGDGCSGVHIVDHLEGAALFLQPGPVAVHADELVARPVGRNRSQQHVLDGEMVRLVSVVVAVIVVVVGRRSSADLEFANGWSSVDATIAAVLVVIVVACIAASSSSARCRCWCRRRYTIALELLLVMLVHLHQRVLVLRNGLRRHGPCGFDVAQRLLHLCQRHPTLRMAAVVDGHRLAQPRPALIHVVAFVCHDGQGAVGKAVRYRWSVLQCATVGSIGIIQKLGTAVHIPQGMMQSMIGRTILDTNLEDLACSCDMTAGMLQRTERMVRMRHGRIDFDGLAKILACLDIILTLLVFQLCQSVPQECVVRQPLCGLLQNSMRLLDVTIFG
mmetsp:Transcript_11786/g.33965  ORF Transcript_11786/g.33965 Transcript_11786/m.33965 type:complete len:371 (-) Transcript_11786:1646-2758(-)